MVALQGSTKFQLICFGFGQLIMLLNVCSGIFSKYLQDVEKASIPTLQSTFLYVLLAVVYLPLRWYRRQPDLGIKWWFYVLLALVDVEANYFAVKAFGYANYVTLGLLLNLTVPFVTVLTYVFLKTRYTKFHYFGSVVAICGGVVIFISDYNDSPDVESWKKALYGNILCIIAAGLYATSNVMFQATVKTRDMNSNIEALGFVGLWGAIFSGAQVAILERDTVDTVDWNGRVLGYIAGFVLVLFTFYTITSVFLRWAESLMFNLNLITGPVFTMIAADVFFNEGIRPLYWLALGLFYVGLLMYCSAPPPKQNAASQAAETDLQVTPRDMNETKDYSGEETFKAV